MATKQIPGMYAPDGSLYTTSTDGNFTLAGATAGGYPAGAVAVAGSSGNVAAATATATIAAVAGKTNYLSGFSITGSGATAASVVTATITGLVGGTQTYVVPVVAGATLGNFPLDFDFYPSIPATATNVAITLSVPSLGAGNTNCAAVVYGYQV